MNDFASEEPHVICAAQRARDGWRVLLSIRFNESLRGALLTPERAEALASELLKYAAVCRGEHAAQN